MARFRQIFVQRPVFRKTVRFSHQLILIIPVERIENFSAWWAAEARSGSLPHDDPSEWGEANADGSDAPATHRYSHGTYLPQQSTVLLKRLTSTLQTEPPENWESMTNEEKKAWTLGVRDTLFSQSGVWIAPAYLGETKLSLETELARLNLKRRGSAIK